MGLISRFKENLYTKELEQRVAELRVVIEAISQMRALELEYFGVRLVQAERDVAQSYSAPTSDVFRCTGLCWAHRGAIIGDARATAKRTMPNLTSSERVSRIKANHMILVCDLLLIAYRVAILEQSTETQVESCRNVRAFIIELVEVMKLTVDQEIAPEKLELQALEFLQRSVSLPWVLQPMKVYG